MSEKVKLERVTFYRKEPYGMHAEDWYVKGYDKDQKFHEGWASDFEFDDPHRR